LFKGAPVWYKEILMEEDEVTGDINLLIWYVSTRVRKVAAGVN